MDNFDKEFDKIYSKDFNKPIDISPGETDWLLLEKRLKKTKTLPFSLWWMIPMLLCLSMLWMGAKIFTLEDELYLLSKKYALAIEKNTTTDTVFQSLLHYDTIYRTIVITSKIKTDEKNSKSNNTSDMDYNISKANIIYEPKYSELSIAEQTRNDININTAESVKMDEKSLLNQSKPKINPLIEDIKDTISNDTVNKSITPESTNKKNNFDVIPFDKSDDIVDNFKKPAEQTDSSAIHTDPDLEGNKSIIKIPKAGPDTQNEQLKDRQIPELTSRPEGETEEKTNILEDISKKFKENILENEPAHWRIGISLGSGRPLGNSKLEIENSINSSIHAEWIFGSKWSIVPSLAYHSYDMNLEGDFDLKTQLPPPISLGSEYEFEYFESKVRQVLPSVSLRYRFASDAPYSGYLGIGCSARFSLKTTIEYEYKKLNSNDHYSEYVEHTFPKRYSILKLNGGFVANLNSKASLFADIESFLDYGSSPRHYVYLGGALGIRLLVK